MTDTQVQPAPETGAGDDDVRASVQAAFEQLTQDTPAPEGEAETAAAGEVDAAPERTRNERGQFTKAEGAGEKAVGSGGGGGGTPDPQPEIISDADPAADKPAAPSKASAEPPTSWSADAKAEWSKLSPALQQAVLKREAEISDGGRRWSEDRRAYDEMLAPVRQAAQRAGIDEREGLKRLIAANDYLERDPENAIRAMAQAYGVDLTKPANTTPQAQPAQATDPRLNSLLQKVQTLETALTSRERAEVQREISAFATAPGHEHFDAVKGTMGKLMQVDPDLGMQDAYDRAVWADPSIRSQLIADQNAKAEADRISREKAQAATARRAAISLNGAPAGNVPAQAKPEYNTVDEAVRAAWNQHMPGRA